MEHEQNGGSVGLTLEDLEEQILRGKAAIALKKNLKEVNQALQTVKDDVATMEETINVDSGVVEDEQPLAGRRLAKFPFVDDCGGRSGVARIDKCLQGGEFGLPVTSHRKSSPSTLVEISPLT